MFLSCNIPPNSPPCKDFNRAWLRCPHSAPLSIASSLASVMVADFGDGESLWNSLWAANCILCNSCILPYNFHTVIICVSMWIQLFSFFWFYPQSSFHVQPSASQYFASKKSIINLKCELWNYLVDADWRKQGTPRTKILALNLGQLIFQMQEYCLSQTEATSR